VGKTNPLISYRPRDGATPEGELNALSACYAFILQRHQVKQRGGPATAAPDNPERRSDEIRADKAIIPE
jgi:hypothetical protein